MLRVHQYAKNALIFLPLLAAHLFTLEAFAQAILAFVAFSLCASSIYILNDLVDLQDDRGHRSKCKRPSAERRHSPDAWRDRHSHPLPCSLGRRIRRVAAVLRRVARLFCPDNRLFFRAQAHDGGRRDHAGRPLFGPGGRRRRRDIRGRARNG